MRWRTGNFDNSYGIISEDPHETYAYHSLQMLQMIEGLECLQYLETEIIVLSKDVSPTSKVLTEGNVYLQWPTTL
jgi:hypothetical protein